LVRIELLVSKNKGTSLLRNSEKRSLTRFLALYIILVTMVLSLLGGFYYKSQEDLMFSKQKILLSNYVNRQRKKLKHLHHAYPQETHYPRSRRYRSAIYDIERVEIFSTLKNNNVRFDKQFYHNEDTIQVVKYLDDYYLGAKYLFIEIDQDNLWYKETWSNILMYGSVALIVLVIFGLFFVKLFLRPMKNSIVLLDNFIKDTTHELNTPIAAILANVEMMDMDGMSEKNRRKIDRINIAAKTVSHLYHDLTYLTLGHNHRSNDEWVDLKKLLEDRVEYFTLLAGAKKVTFELSLASSTLYVDSIKIARVFDNLISNAIKYNKRNGKIMIELGKEYFLIRDTGIGMKVNELDDMFNRYTRFDSCEGGFGIGLNIVKTIIDEYNLKVSVESIYGEGTTIRIDFKEGIPKE